MTLNGTEMYLSEEFTSASWSPLPPCNLFRAMGGEEAAGERYIVVPSSRVIFKS
jgi:hypothetical protein